MASLIPGFEYDVFVSYRHKDNKYDGWVTEFVANLKKELEATFKEEVSVYFDENPHDGLLETHNVDKSLQQKLKCLVFIPIVSQTYCDPKSFAWQHEFCAFNRLAKEDQLGRDIKLSNGNYASRILSIKIHSLDPKDKALIENELGEILRSIDFIFKSAGVNRPLRANEDHPKNNINNTFYRDQLNKVANAIKEIISSVRGEEVEEAGETFTAAPVAKRHERNYKPAILSLILISVLALGWWVYTTYDKQAPEISDKSVAVLPFVNMSSDPEQEYFSNGLTEDIITQLAKISAFKVISRTSVMQYKQFPKPLKDVGREMGVAFVLEGSVQRSGDQVRITAQLIHAATDEHLWAESYDRPIKDIFSIQREVATAIASVLKATLSAHETSQLSKTKTSNLHAYDSYLRGKYAMEIRSKLDMYRAKSFFEQAIELDPSFAPAYSGLADVHLLLSIRGYANPKIFLALTKTYLDKALELDPASAEVHASSGFWHYQNFDFKEAETQFRKSLEMNPNQDNVYNWLAALLEQTGRDTEALEVYRKGIEVNPSFAILRGNMLNVLFALNPAEAINQTKVMLDSTFSDPEQKFFYLIALSKYHFFSGNREDAIRIATDAGIGELVKFYKESNNDELVKEVKEKYSAAVRGGEYVSPFFMGFDFAMAGARDLAMENFEKALELKEPVLPLLLSKGFHSSALIPEDDPELTSMKRKIRKLIKYDWPPE